MIDINYDFRTDTPEGKDPDAYSSTLRSYHCLLWSKPLPNGEVFSLTKSQTQAYLYHKSLLGEFNLSSDAITHSYRNTKRMAPIVSQVTTEQLDSLFGQGCTIGSYIIFPKNKIKGQQSINQSRGCNHKLADRFDLALECIRLFYANEDSPIRSVLERHSDFFELFNDFKGYVDFFLLQDLVDENYTNIKYHLAHTDFSQNPLPQTVDEYLEYRENTLNFIKARNQRIYNYCIAT